jgi:hypothetical protein
MKGIDPERLATLGYGGSLRIDNATEEENRKFTGSSSL